jgi:hypothetical protein
VNGYELAASHSISSSAMASSVGGTVRPRAFAVLRLITNSNLVGRTTAGQRASPLSKSVPRLQRLEISASPKSGAYVRASARLCRLAVRELVLNDLAPFAALTMTKRGKQTDYETKNVTLAGRWQVQIGRAGSREPYRTGGPTSSPRRVSLRGVPAN